MMSPNDLESPTKLFEIFDNRDYYITNFNDNNDFAASLSKIYSNNGIVAMIYKDGLANYSTLKDNKRIEVIAELLEDGSVTKSTVNSIIPVDTSAFVPSIFFDFGVSTQGLYDASAEDSDSEDPILTADMLTVSDDLSKCMFS